MAGVSVQLVRLLLHGRHCSVSCELCFLAVEAYILTHSVHTIPTSWRRPVFVTPSSFPCPAVVVRGEFALSVSHARASTGVSQRRRRRRLFCRARPAPGASRQHRRSNRANHGARTCTVRPNLAGAGRGERLAIVVSTAARAGLAWPVVTSSCPCCPVWRWPAAARWRLFALSQLNPLIW